MSYDDICVPFQTSANKINLQLNLSYSQSCSANRRSSLKKSTLEVYSSGLALGYCTSHAARTLTITDSSSARQRSSSFFSVQGSVFSRIDALLGGLEWAVESTTVTHSSADWWDLLLPLAYRHQLEGTNGFYCLIRKTLESGVNRIAKVPKAFLPKWDSNHRPSGRRSTLYPTWPPPPPPPVTHGHTH